MFHKQWRKLNNCLYKYQYFQYSINKIGKPNFIYLEPLK